MLNLKSAKEQMPAINIFRFVAECLRGSFFLGHPIYKLNFNIVSDIPTVHIVRLLKFLPGRTLFELPHPDMIYFMILASFLGS